MHVLTGRTLDLAGASAEPVDLEQTPGDIVVLTAADTELSGLAAARRALGGPLPSVRLGNWMQLAHPYSVDLYVERVLSRARIVILRLLGGRSYWRYGLEETVRAARANGIALAVLSGEATFDPALAEEGTLGPAESLRLWTCLAEGGAENLRRALAYAAHLIGAGEDPGEAVPLASAGIVGPEPAGGPVAAIVFYRALMQAGQTEPVEALAAALAERGLSPLLLFVGSLKVEADAAFTAAALARHRPAVVLNATSFAVSQPGQPFAGTALDGWEGGRPVIQVAFSGSSEAAWAASARGLSPADLTMNVVLPEVDGRIIGRAVSFKEVGELDPLTQCRPVRFRAKADRVAFVAELAARWAALAAKPNGAKRVAVVLSNYPNRDGRIANGVGLDAPQSCGRLIAALREAGYATGDAPESGTALMEVLLAGPTNARAFLSPSKWEGEGSRLPVAAYRACFVNLPESVRAAVTERWGTPDNDPFVDGDAFLLPAHRFGNLVVGIQPARGFNIDPKATYHDPDLVPPHGYLAFYLWLREQIGVDAIVHMGKHGNLEWLPGKALALSAGCFPEAALGPVPVIYPFIVNDPGEGAQAKRRSAAVVVDHLMPPVARAESHGVAVELERLIDEYAAAEAADEKRAPALAVRILDLSRAHGFDRDLGIGSDADRDAALARLDEHLCDLKELQIRDGLHVFGTSPGGVERAATLVALARVPRGSRAEDASLLRALADDLELGFDPLDSAFAEPWEGPRPALLTRSLPPCVGGSGRGEGHGASIWRTVGDTVERLEALALDLVRSCAGREGQERDPSPHPGHPPQGKREKRAPGSRSAAVLGWLRDIMAPALDTSGSRETAAVLDALAGRFVAPGPSGAPTRGRPDCLPTGRNFYSVDVRAVPTEAAWELGRRSADLVAERYLADEGDWPKAVALTVWGTSNMRTGGDDLAQALAFIGAKPVWEPASGRVTGIEVLPLSALNRPRVDVTLRISGFFRDAFPAQIELFHQAVGAVAERDEPDDANPIAARVRADAAALAAAGLDEDAARQAASTRVFGSKPGAYGAGLQALIDEGIWAERADLAAAFLEWSAYAYGGGSEGAPARNLIETRLKATDAVIQNQDNREHDLLDSDDYYQFGGGLSAAVGALRGAAPKSYHNDHSRPERPVVRGLDEEIARVVRGRAANPKWIAGVMRHGYKGAFEIAATVDYLFAFAATTDAVRHHHFEQIYDAYIADEAVRGFIADSNAPALREIAAKFCEAVDRGLWAPRRNSAYDDLAAMAGRAAA